MFITRTALPITSALRFWPEGPLGTATASQKCVKRSYSKTGDYQDRVSVLGREKPGSDQHHWGEDKNAKNQGLQPQR
jgi:hypothetical protein